MARMPTMEVCVSVIEVKTVHFEIPGAPGSKARHRTVSGHTYTPAKTAAYENLVKICFREQCKDMPHEGQVGIEVVAYFPVPKSASKKRRDLMLAGVLRPKVKPDWDNIGKICSDALNGIAYRDDSQVVDAVVRKWYGERPRVEVKISFM